MEYVWVRCDTEDDIGLVFGACIVERLRNLCKIRDDNGNELYVKYSDLLRPMHPSCIKDVDDMILLGDLQEYTILRNMELRYMKNLIYTYAGNILIAVNPYQTLPIYGEEIMKRYRGRKLGELPPHLFAIGDASYENMIINNKKQCIIITGESGAGKTQSAKLLLHYYAAITGKHSEIKERILESNTILEAFGNAKTVRNDNSSRFGKYTSINFNWEGKMKQAEIKMFFLEKSRVVLQSRGERNYHMFYMLVNGLSDSEKDLLGLMDVPCYKYLFEGDCYDDKSKEERIDEFAAFRKALTILNFSNNLVWNIFELLAVILHFGNVVYSEVIRDGVDAVEVWDSRELNILSMLTAVPKNYLKTCLSKRTIFVGSDKVLKEMSVQEAADARDGFAKAIYVNLFNFIVSRINEATSKRDSNGNAYIGVLDVFGFENYDCNSFEQFCINLANEHLQQFFIHHTFKLEQRQYMEEGIAWKNIGFVDNKDVIEMMSVDSVNMIDIINDQSKFPNSTGETLLWKLIEHHGENENFLRPKFNNILVFGIRHFAGDVLYDIKNFLEKNRDSYSDDFLSLVKFSENSFLKKIFAKDLTGEIQSSKKKMRTTSATKFKNSLGDLMIELNQCQPFFIRCVNPNDEKKPRKFNRKLCCLQLRSSGIWDMSRIRQVGYCIRFTYFEFVVRYGPLKSGLMPVNRLTQMELKSVAGDICYTYLMSRMELQFGHDKIFLKNMEYLKLEKERERVLSQYVTVLQTAFRRYFCRRRYLALRIAAIAIQKHWRGAISRRRYKRWCHGILRLQSAIQTRYQRYLYLHIRRIIKRRKQNLRSPHKEKLQKSDGQPPSNIAEFPRNNLVQRDSYVHGRVKSSNHFPEASNFIDDYFHFLYDHKSPKKTNEDR